MDEVDAILLNLRAARLANGWSQRRVADAVGTVRSQICVWEAGAVMPSLANAMRWAQALGYRIDLSPIPSGSWIDHG